MSVLPKVFKLKKEPVEIEFDLPAPEDFCDYAYDFEKNELKTLNGRHYFVYGNEALKIWIYKAMVTDRFRFLAYSDQFGTEIYTLIGEVVSDKLKREEIKRYIVETLMVHPFIKSINKIEMETFKAGLYVAVYFTSIFNDDVEYVKCTIQI